MTGARPRPESRRVISLDEVVAGGCRHFLRRSTIDMDALALELAISRATLYRVVNGRDRLLGDVLWRLGEPIWNGARAARTTTGVAGVLQVTRRFAELLLASKPYADFLRAEPETAARVLFTASGGVHVRAIAAQKAILAEAAGPGDRWADADLDHVAYLYVRIVESMLYARLLTGREPDLALAERAVRALLEAC